MALCPLRSPTLRPDCIEGSRKDAIDPLQKRIDWEANRARYAQNSHVDISLLPVELLSDVFLYVVESGLRKGNTCFTAGTFDFLQACRRWYEVAVAFPQLWVWWVAKAGKAWHLFNARSGDALAWQYQFPDPARDAFMDTRTPRRIRRLNFFGSREDLDHLLSALDSSSVSITSSIRVVTDCGDKGEHLTRFLSLPFPRLSELNVAELLPGPSSSIFTTSNLTSLKLDHRRDCECRYTRSQLSQILQRHPNLQKLVLGQFALPPVEGSGVFVPIVLPRLVDLTLYGLGTLIAGFMDLVGMSPLHNVVIHLERYGTVPVLSGAVKQILSAYYECQGLEYPRKVDNLTVSLGNIPMVIHASSSATSACHPTYNSRLQSFDTSGAFIGKIIPLFPLEHTQVFAATKLGLIEYDWRMVFQKMKGLLHLQLDSIDIRPVLNALRLDNRGVCEGPLKSC